MPPIIAAAARSHRVVTREVSTADARNNFADVVNHAVYGKERIHLTRRGKTIALIIPADDPVLLQTPEGGSIEEDI